MDNVTIHTAQNVDIQYKLASVADRILATLLDYLFFIAYALCCLLLFKLINYSVYNIGAGLSTILLLPVMLYSLVCETFFQGQSVGKMIMKIQVVKLDGSQPRFSNYLLRWILRIIDISLLFGAIALIVIVINGKGQRLGDIAAATTVIKLKQKATLQDTIFKPVATEYALVFKEVAKLNDRDISIIKDVLEFSLKNNNTAALQKLSQKTRQTMGVNSTLSAEQFLETVLDDYNHFHFGK